MPLTPEHDRERQRLEEAGEPLPGGNDEGELQPIYLELRCGHLAIGNAGAERAWCRKCDEFVPVEKGEDDAE